MPLRCAVAGYSLWDARLSVRITVPALPVTTNSKCDHARVRGRAGSQEESPHGPEI